MNEDSALARLRQGDERALEWFVARYTPYVGAIVWSIVGGRLSVQDGEEITADVFLTLWHNRTKPRRGAVKSYLGAIARSRPSTGCDGRRACRSWNTTNWTWLWRAPRGT